MEISQQIQSGSERFARFGRTAVAGAVLVLVAACGGGSGGSGDAAGTGDAGSAGGTGGTDSPAVVAAKTPTKAEASRFLAQATFGPSEADINKLSGMSYGAWIDEQMAKPQTLHRLYINQATADLASVGQQISPTNFFDSWWAQAIGGDDQLRQRAAFALSEILVISFTDSTLRNQTRGVASYYDMLGEKAFGNYRDILESVALHPMMGIYLSWLKNEKEDPATGRVPDLNFAREITQLFAVGEYKLNVDGSNQMGADGRPAPAYTSKDLEGLSQMFTGYSWYAGPQMTDRTRNRFYGNDASLERDWRPMQAYNNYTANTDFHSISQKNFWGVSVAPQTKSDNEGDFKLAIDTVFNNPSVGPFVAKQLIQRMVTSNPSPAYVGRVASVFNDNGKGVRGDMASVWKAILLDTEARTASTAPTYGKVREPVVRLANMLRAFNAKSTSTRYTGIGNTDDPASRLNQTPMFAPTVFNFFRPGYVPTSKAITDAGVVVPELQITHDVSVAGYMNYIRTWVQLDKNRDIQHNYTAEVALATSPGDLVERMNLLLFGGTMPDALKTQITTAVASRVIPVPVYASTNTTGGTLSKIANEGESFTVTGTGTVRYGAGTTFVEKSVTGAGQCTNDFFGSDPVPGTGKACFLFTPAVAAGASAASGAASAPAVASNQAAIDAAKLDRVYLAVYLSMASPDYLVQK